MKLARLEKALVDAVSKTALQLEPRLYKEELERKYPALHEASQVLSNMDRLLISRAADSEAAEFFELGASSIQRNGWINGCQMRYFLEYGEDPALKDHDWLISNLDYSESLGIHSPSFCSVLELGVPQTRLIEVDLDTYKPGSHYGRRFEEAYQRVRQFNQSPVDEAILKIIVEAFLEATTLP